MLRGPAVSFRRRRDRAHVNNGRRPKQQSGSNTTSLSNERDLRRGRSAWMCVRAACKMAAGDHGVPLISLTFTSSAANDQKRKQLLGFTMLLPSGRTEMKQRSAHATVGCLWGNCLTGGDVINEITCFPPIAALEFDPVVFANSKAS